MAHHPKTLYTLQGGNTTFTFLPTGDIYTMVSHGKMINRDFGNLVEGAKNNFFLRHYQEDGQVVSYPLLGIESTASFSIDEAQRAAVWTGDIDLEDYSMGYSVTFTLSDKDVWFWEIRVDADDEVFDILMKQDLGFGDEGDRRFLDVNGNHIVVSIQQGEIPGTYHYVQHGAVGESHVQGRSYGTVHGEKTAGCESYLGYITIETAKIAEGQKAVFYGLCKVDERDPLPVIGFTDEIGAAAGVLNKLHHLEPMVKISRKPNIGGELAVDPKGLYTWLGTQLVYVEIEGVYYNLSQPSESKKVEDTVISYFHKDGETFIREGVFDGEGAYDQLQVTTESGKAYRYFVVMPKTQGAEGIEVEGTQVTLADEHLLLDGLLTDESAFVVLDIAETTGFVVKW